MNQDERRAGFEMRRMFAACLVSLLIFGQVFAQAVAPTKAALSAEEKALTAAVRIETLKNFTAALSAREMEGRGTMQPGGDRAAAWIADRFKEFGLKPLGDNGSYLQKVKFRETIYTPETRFKVGDLSFRLGTDYGLLPQNNGDQNRSGELVFLAYGVHSKRFNRQDLAGADLRGKVAVILDGPPADMTEDVWKTAQIQSSVMRTLVMSGVSAIVFIPHGREKDPPEMLIDYFSRRQISTPDEEGYPAFVPPFVFASAKTAEQLFKNSPVSYKDALAQAEKPGFKPISLNQKAEITVRAKTTLGTSSNVVGYIEGSDPRLKEEAVLFSAHYDAYGVENGQIYYGAADNALGTAEMLAVAGAFSKMSPKPKRSLIFLAVTGEEYGLYGSKHWAKNPTWDITKVAANLNLDGVGTEVYGPVKTMVGYGAEHSTLGAILADVSSALGITVVPDPVPDEKIFYRSDHYSFVERGVPALMLMGAPAGDIQATVKRMKEWEKTHYHRPGDVIQPDWSWEGAKAVADVMAIMGLRLADAPAMPSWLSTSRFAGLKRGNNEELPKEQ